MQSECMSGGPCEPHAVVWTVGAGGTEGRDEEFRAGER